MDQDLKQRLVGAVVITALAAIFIPMLFDGPIDESGKIINELKIPDAPVKSYGVESINLPESVDDVVKLPEPEAIKKQVVAQKDASKMISWYLQVGSFGQKTNAMTLQSKLRKQGFPALISNVSETKGILYKVRVGPVLNKKRALEMKQKVDKLNDISSIVTNDE